MVEQSATVVRRLVAIPTAAGLAARLATAELERRNIDAPRLLARAGLSAAALDQRDRISVASQIEFLELASREAGDDFFGFSLAEKVDLRELSMLYYVAASSHRLGDGLRRFERYVCVGNEALVARIETGAVCRVGLSYAGVPRHLDRHQMEFLTLVVLRMCRQLVGRMLVPRVASFVHHRSDNLQRVRKLLGCEVEFDARADGLSFDAEVMDLPMVGADPFLHELMLKCCEEAKAVRIAKVSPFRTVVENVIAPLLPHAEAQAKAVAKELGLSERTFARRLAAEGLSFGEILDGLRRDLALRYLEEPELQISQIAWLLGFHQPSAFSHACRRWTGKRPSQRRRSRDYS
ncbi:AraC family transcriptional regulator [Mesorhizobium erdmanii]|uniref:AraC family transcriptional regulator n=2 Tax=Mesorhizobium TaxID=68287 RepID=A0A3M9XD83_9HYPH|nr:MULTISPECIES: AraC family transcriptional regulator [Mesorhizobium]RNJ45825.1 AraC family transcriptional regulator [Mesorhizobium japonicum]RXT47132.1 AraC family transcriptional regulator [Mesorhizobium erdmanii]